MFKKTRLLAFLLLSSVLLLTGCSEASKEISNAIVSEISQTIVDEGIDTLTDVYHAAVEKTEEIQSTENSNPTFNTSELYVELNGGQPTFTDEEKTSTEAFELYSDLDALGRCQVAYANICQELLPTEERGEIGMIKPAGWHTVKYDCVDGKYLYNRCHLIAFCLAGENANEKNLITGTRYFNVEGMLPYETMVAKYMDNNPDNHVLYRVTPVFTGDNLIADAVIMEAWSVEDNGTGICFNVRVNNIQPGVTINYTNGESELSEE